MQALISLVYQTKPFESVQIDFDYNLQSIFDRRNELGAYDMWNRYDNKIFEMLFRKIHKQIALHPKLNSLFERVSFYLFLSFSFSSLSLSFALSHSENLI